MNGLPDLRQSQIIVEVVLVFRYLRKKERWAQMKCTYRVAGAFSNSPILNPLKTHIGSHVVEVVGAASNVPEVAVSVAVYQ